LYYTCMYYALTCSGLISYTQSTYIDSEIFSSEMKEVLWTWFFFHGRINSPYWVKESCRVSYYIYLRPHAANVHRRSQAVTSRGSLSDRSQTVKGMTSDERCYCALHNNILYALIILWVVCIFNTVTCWKQTKKDQCPVRWLHR